MKVVRTIERGERVADILDEVKALTFSTGNEHAVMRLANGERVVVSGGPGGIDFEPGEVKRLLGHTHPYHKMASSPSAEDLLALEALGQRSSYLLEHGILQRYWRR